MKQYLYRKDRLSHTSVLCYDLDAYAKLNKKEQLMIFCGQCGFQLAPGMQRCPRCGAIAEPGEGTTIEALPTDGPTVASKSILQAPPQGYETTRQDFNPQPPLILRNNAGETMNRSSGAYGGYEAPTRGIPPTYNPYQTQAATSPADWQGYAAPAHVAPPSTPYNMVAPSQSGLATPSSPSYPQTDIPASGRGGGRTVGLILILLGLLLVLGAMGFFAYQHNMLPWLSHSSSTSSTSGTSTLTPAQQADNVITQYYNYINHHEYQRAYNLRKDITNYRNFVKGYQYTQHVTLTITGTQPLSDGTVKVLITLVAVDSNKPQPTTYNGYYIVGPQNGQWFILSGQATPA